MRGVWCVCKARFEVWYLLCGALECGGVRRGAVLLHFVPSPSLYCLHTTSFMCNLDSTEHFLRCMQIGASCPRDALSPNATQQRYRSHAMLQDGMTALLYGAEKGHREVVAMLHTLGAALDARVAGTGATALHLAARRGHMETVRWIAENCALLTVADNVGAVLSLWGWCVRSGDGELLLNPIR